MTTTTQAQPITLAVEQFEIEHDGVRYPFTVKPEEGGGIQVTPTFDLSTLPMAALPRVMGAAQATASHILAVSTK